ncbi:MAG: hypothetical protein DMG36_16835 [Acidobacteria bacterium]|nr:MAG: hypothetical protein DMG36_16835 [Acidobacteriota bacterium]
MTESDGRNGEVSKGDVKEVEVIPTEDLEAKALQAFPTQASGTVLEPLQRVGLWLALAFFGYILIASGTIFFVSFHTIQLPPFPTPPANSGDPEHYKALADAYKQSVDVYQQIAKAQVERATQLFQLVVASTILPVFSAILGYIFGANKSRG